MTSLIEPNPVPATSARLPGVDLAGVRWPVNKLHAVIAGLLAALIAVIVTGSGVTTMWITAAVVLSVWWGERAWFAVHESVTRRS